jgi:hypothetical protein
VPDSGVDAASCGASLVYLMTQSAPAGGNSGSVAFETFSPQTGAVSSLGTACAEITSALQGAVAVAMAVDRNGFFYVALPETKGNELVPGIVRVDATTMECDDTNFGPVGIAAKPELDLIMGMAFVQDASPAGESLYFIGNETRAGQPFFLGVADATTFQWRLVGPLTVWGTFAVPLTGRSQLYAEAQPNIGGAIAASPSIGFLDITTAALTVLWDIPLVYDDEPPFTLWAGDYYRFTDIVPGPVTRFRPQDGSSVQIATTTSTVLAAATSTCAP